MQWDIHYEILKTDGWSFLELSEIAIQPQGTGDLRRATVGHLRVDFNLHDLWNNGLRGVQKISARMVAVETTVDASQGLVQAKEDPVTLSWMPEWWDRLPPIAIHHLTWRENDLDLIRLDQIQFRLPSPSSSVHQVQIEGDRVQLAATIGLDSEQVLVDLNLDHLQWNNDWHRPLTDSIPASLQASATAKVQLRLPLDAPKDFAITVHEIVATGRQPGTNWVLQGSSEEELVFNWTKGMELHSWSGSFRFALDDWPSFRSSWGLPLDDFSIFGQLQSLSTQLGYANGEITISEATLRTDRGAISAAQSRLRLTETDGQWWVGIPHLQVNVRAENDYQLPNGTMLPAGSGHWVVQSLQDFPLTLDPPELSLLIPEFAWESHDGSQWVRQTDPMHLAYSSAGLIVPNWNINTPAGSLELKAQVPTSRQGDLPLESTPWSASLASDGCDLAALQLLPCMPILPVRSGMMQGTVVLGGTQDAPVIQGDWSLQNLQLHPEQLARRGPSQLDLAIRFAWDTTGLTLHEVQYQDPAASLKASGHWAVPILAVKEPDRFRQLWETIPFLIEGEAQAEDVSWISDFLLFDFPIRDGELDLVFSAQGSAVEPRIQAEVSAVRWNPQGEWAERLPSGHMSIQLTGKLQEGIFEVNSDLAIGNQLLATVQGEVRQILESSPVYSLQLATPKIQPEWMGWQGTAMLEAQLTGSGETLALEALLEGVQLEPIGTNEEHATPPFDLTANLHWGQDVLEILDLHATGQRLQIQATASMELPLKPILWPSLAIAELPMQATLQGQVDVMDWLATLPSLRRAKGQLGFQAALAGPLKNPDWRGQFDLEHGAFRLTAPGLPPLENLTLHAVLDDTGLKFRDSHGELGAAPFMIDGGMQLQSDGSIWADMTLEGEDLLLYRTSGAKIRADSQLSIQGRWPQLTIGGNLAFGDSRWVQNIPLLRSPVGPPRPPSPGGLTLFRLAPPLDQLRFAVDLSGDPGLHLRSNLARGQMRPQLSLEGTGAVPVLRGEVYLNDVSMALPATRLYLQPSIVRFLEDDPFHPHLELLGRSSLYGYEVQVVVTGHYDQPQVLLTSSPPLPEADILVLLTTGQPPANRLDRRAAAGTVALYLARDFLTTFFGNDSIDAEENLLNRIEINFGRDQTRNGVETVNGRLRLRDNVLREGDILYLEGGRDAFEDYFLGLELLLRFQ
ncbi:MAG: translocation/assembly module TamB domain-containing protein [Planctomycetota bacterium]